MNEIPANLENLLFLDKNKRNALDLKFLKFSQNTFGYLSMKILNFRTENVPYPISLTQISKKFWRTIIHGYIWGKTYFNPNV